MANPHLPFPRVHAYTKARRRGGEEGVEGRREGKATKGKERRRQVDREERLQRRKRERGERERERERAGTGPVCLLSAPLPLSAVLIPAIFN